MKKFFLVAMMAVTALTSCQKDESFNQNDIIGEWKATKIEATFDDGRVWSTSDSDELRYQLEGLEWVTVTEHHFQPMYYAQEYGQQILIPYNISDNYIVFTGAESDATYYLQSVTKNEMVIKYTGEWTSLIYYTKVK